MKSVALFSFLISLPLFGQREISMYEKVFSEKESFEEKAVLHLQNYQGEDSAIFPQVLINSTIKDNLINHRLINNHLDGCVKGDFLKTEDVLCQIQRLL